MFGYTRGDESLARMVGNSPLSATDANGLRKSGNYTVKGTDHHLVPVETWELFGFADEAKAICDAGLIATPNGHNYTAHGAVNGYTGHVIDEMSAQLKKYFSDNKINGTCLTIEQQKDFANKFLKHIKSGTANKYINGFNAAVPKGATAVANWWNAIGDRLPKPSGAGATTKITGIAKLAPSGRGGIWRKVAGKIGKYVLAPIAGISLYNNLRSERFSAEQAAAMTTAEYVNPIPFVGVEDAVATGKWFDRCHATATTLRTGTLSESDLIARGLLGNGNSFDDTWGVVGTAKGDQKASMDIATGTNPAALTPSELKSRAQRFGR